MFHEIKVSDLSFNPFTRLDKDWALVTVTDPDTGKTNTMTVSWGGVGVLWGKNVVTIYIRPQRYTHEFLEKTDRFTLSFYDMSKEGMRQSLTLCGRKSGRISCGFSFDIFWGKLFGSSGPLFVVTCRSK